MTEAVGTLNPGYFALVMAGIVSVGMRDHGLTALSTALSWLTAISYAVLVVLTICRATPFPAALRADFIDPSRGFGFLTFVAGTDVLGTRPALPGTRIPLALLAVGGVAWILLGYVVPWTAVLGRQDRPVIARANGT